MCCCGFATLPCEKKSRYGFLNLLCHVIDSYFGKYGTPCYRTLKPFLHKIMTRKAFCSEMLEVKEIFVRLIVMVGFLLQIRLLQLIWSSRKDDTKQMDLWMAEKKVFYVIFTLHAAGLLITFLVHQNNTFHGDVVSSSGLSQLHTFWENLKSYSGLVLDGFLLPQILLNLFRNSKGNALSCAYDLFEALVYVDGSSLYEDKIADYYSTCLGYNHSFGKPFVCL
ncbi:hypothetical protein ACSQ67_026087 [Phaseolus vulgaris]